VIGLLGEGSDLGGTLRRAAFLLEAKELVELQLEGERPTFLPCRAIYLDGA
jgi:hypothetical protein